MRQWMEDIGTVHCHCGSHATLKPNSVIYNGKSFGNLPYAYICDKFPACRGSVGVHPDGKPLGTIPDQETKKWRIKVHSVIDPLWQNRKDRSRSRNRGSVYGWLKRIWGKEWHTGEASKEDCIKILELIEKNPYLLEHQLVKGEE